MGINKIFNSLNVVSEGNSYNSIGLLVSKSGTTANPGITSFIVRDDSTTGVNTRFPTETLTVSGTCRITDLPTGGRYMVTSDAAGKLYRNTLPGFPPFGDSGCSLTGITVLGPVITFYLAGSGCTATTFTASTSQSNITPYEFGLGVNAIQPILPGTNLSNAQLSNIQGGTNNLIEAGSGWSNILGGISNRLINTSRYSSVGGGIDNRIDESQVSSILGGHHNRINITGFTNGYGLITAGFENTVLRRYGSVINGALNTVIHDFSAIIGAQNTTTDRTYTTFMEGLDVNSNRGNGSPDGQAFRYYGGFANPGIGRFLSDVDGLGNAVWKDIGFPDFGGTGCTLTGITVVGQVITFHVAGPDCSGNTFTASTVGANLSPYEWRANDSISTVVPAGGSALDNFISSGQFYSNTQGGHSNKINTAGNSNFGGQNAIGGGRLNVIGGTNVKVLDGNVAWSNIGGGFSNRITGYDQYYMNISGGRKNQILNSGYGHIGGGNENIITASTRSFIGGGESNHIRPNSDYGVIGGGVVNYIINNDNSFIGGGSYNTIYYPNSVIGGGGKNAIGNSTVGSTKYAGIFAGSGNTIGRTAEYSGIVNGSGNIMDDKYSAIIGAQDLTTNRPHTTFTEGLDIDSNRGGLTNATTLKYHGSWAQPGLNYVLTDIDGSGNAQWQPLGIPSVSGDCYVVSATTNSATCVTTFYLSGVGCGTVTASTCDGSYSPYRPTGNQSIVPTIPGALAVGENIIDATSANSNVGGGVFNRIQTTSTNAVIAGGRLNRIINASQWSNIGGGVANMIDDSRVSSILGGHQNDINIAGFGNGYGLITAGFENLVSEAYGSIINGRDNIVQDQYSAIIGARAKTTDRTFTTFTEGLDVDSARANGSPDGQAFRYHGGFANPGLDRVLTDVDGLGNAVWKDIGFPDFGGTGCTITGITLIGNVITFGLQGPDCSGSTFTASTTTGTISPYEYSNATDGIVPIRPFGALENINPQGTYNRIGGGDTNHIYFTDLTTPNVPPLTFMVKNNTISNGSSNVISGASTYTTIGNGVENTATANLSTIGNGSSNRIGNWSPGLSLYLFGNMDTILNGKENWVQGTMSTFAKHRTIVNGYRNFINSGSTYASIVNGLDNKTVWGDFSSIVGGRANEIQQASYGAIINGSGNTITRNTIGSAIIGAIGRSASDSETTYTRGLDTNTDGYDGSNRPFKYHGTFANNGTAGHVLTSVNAAGDAHWAPGGTIWTDGCPILSATSNNCTLTLINCTGGTITADTCNTFGSISPYEYRGGLDSISTILPDETAVNTNFIFAGLPYSNIQGGESNSLNSSGQFNAILGGDTNYIGAGGGATIPGAPVPPPQGNIYWSNIGGGSDNQIRGYDVLGDVIAGGRYNVVTATTYGVISGGFGNRLVNGNKNNIGGGGQNTIFGDGGSTIGGGINNSINNSDNASIVGGQDNSLIASHTFIGGGEDNSILNNSTYSSILGGFQNTINPVTGNANYSAIVNGSDNTIQHIYSAIIGGANLTTNRQYTTFMEGLDVNTNRGGVGNAQAFKYHGTFANNGNPGDVLTSVDVFGNAQWQPLGIPSVSGDCYVVSATTNSATCVTTFYLSGVGCGTVTASTCDGSYSPYRPTGNQSIVPTIPGTLAVGENIIDATSANSNIGGGVFNRIQTMSTNAVIAGGRANRVFNTSQWSNIGGGVSNVIDDSRVSSILGGHQNDINIAGLSNGYGLITAGFQNLVTEAYGSIINGRDNVVQDQYSAIIGARAKTTDRTYTTFTEGLDVDSNRADGSPDGQAFKYHGTFANNGTAGDILTSVDALGNAVWGRGFVNNNPDCPFVSAFTTNSGCTLNLIDCSGNTFTATTCDRFGATSPYEIGSGLDSIQPILPTGAFKNHADASWSNIGGGRTNYIHNTSNQSTIGGGDTNSINSLSTVSFIGNGWGNTINSSSVSSIVGGYNNLIGPKSNYTSIVGGSDNEASNTAYSIIGAGKTNLITGGTKSMIGSGEDNKIFGSQFSNISAGKSNKILGNGWYDHIGAGTNNVIQGYSNYSAIAAGSSNTIKGNSTHSFVGAGVSNVISGISSSAIVTGVGNKISQEDDFSSSAILTGQDNTINGSNLSAIINGMDNFIPPNMHSSAVIGADDRVVDRQYTTFMEGLDVDTKRGGAGNAQAFKYHGTFADPGINRVLTDFDGAGNAKWMDSGIVRQDPDCPIVSAYTTNSGCTLNLIDCSGNTFTANTCTTFGSYSPYQIGSTGAFQSIEPVLSPGSANAFASSVGGGGGNIIQGPGGWMARIGGGGTNSIFGDSAYSYIGAGHANTIENSANSVIAGGDSSSVRDSGSSFIGGGALNRIGQVGVSGNQNNFIGGGVGNKMQDETTVSSIVGGYINTINNDSDYNFIGGGYHNRLGEESGPLWTRYSSILGGKNNEIAGDANADYAAIVNGSGNTVSRSYSAVIGGRGLTANRSHTTFMQGLDVDTDHDGVTRSFKYHGTFANPGAGKVLTSVNAAGDAVWANLNLPTNPDVDCYVVSASTATGSCVTTFYLGCSGLTVTANTCDGSYSPYRPTGDNSIVPTVPQINIVGENVIDNLSSNSNVGGGVSNRIMDSDSAVVAGGRFNRILESSEWSNIGGGVSNIIRDSRVSSIVGGHQNEINIAGGSSGYGLITAGYQNTIENRYGSIINGSQNLVQDDFSAIIGAQNITTDRTYTTFMEGLDVNSNRANGSADGQAFRYHGGFADPGINKVLMDSDGAGNAKWRDSGISYIGDEVVVSARTVGCVLTLTTNSGTTITANTCTTYSGPYKEGQGNNNIIPTIPSGGLANYTTTSNTWCTIQGGALNYISGSTFMSSILGGIINGINDSMYSAIISGAGNKIVGATGSVIVNGNNNIIKSVESVIMGTSGVEAFTDKTTYTENQQIHGKARISTQEYNKTNSLDTNLAKMTLDVVHENSTISSLGNDEGGGEIVRFGSTSSSYGVGKLVQLRNNQWVAANAGDTTFQGNLLGIALGSRPDESGVLIRGFFRANIAYDGNSWIAGEPLYVHNGSGQVSNVVPSAPSEYVRNIGYCALSGDGYYVYFNPESTYIVVQ